MKFSQVHVPGAKHICRTACLPDLKIFQVFSLQPLATGQGYFCYNDIFRLNYG